MNTKKKKERERERETDMKVCVFIRACGTCLLVYIYRTSVRCALERRASDIRVLPSTALSRSSCAREETYGHAYTRILHVFTRTKHQCIEKITQL